MSGSNYFIYATFESCGEVPVRLPEAVLLPKYLPWRLLGSKGGTIVVYQSQLMRLGNFLSTPCLVTTITATGVVVPGF